MSPFTYALPRARRSSIVANELRRLIIAGQLKVGDQLPTETKLCQQFGVSRTTLREAVQTLRTNGLLDVTPGRGSFVRTPDLRQLMADMALAGRSQHIQSADIQALRLLIQKDVLSRLKKTSQSQKKDLFQHLLTRTAAPEDNAQLEVNWHLAMAGLGGNPLQKLLLEMLLMLETDHRLRTYRNPDAVMQTIHIQMRTNTALMEGDYALAERVLCQFIAPQLAHLHAAPHPT
ncbi:MAG: FadR family transcriptional regulator, partial [Proteobacteria bacterium]|nr:FadR family transcriptional regulator [Pseudomonadota bacterium]